MVSIITIPSINQPVETIEPNTPLNACSHITRGSCPTAERCDTYGCSGGCIDTDYVVKRSDGAFLSLVELRRMYAVNVAVTVSHIRQLCALEAGI